MYLITTVEIRNFCACSPEVEPASGSPYEAVSLEKLEAHWGKVELPIGPICLRNLFHACTDARMICLAFDLNGSDWR